MTDSTPATAACRHCGKPTKSAAHTECNRCAARLPDISAAALVAAIWAKWDRELRDWDLEGSHANREARELAVLAVQEALDAN